VFAVPWIIFGIQHFMYVDFVAKIVPAYFPAGWFWAYLTGAAMIAAGVSFIVNKKSSLAAALLGTMLLMFIVLIHVPTIAGDSSAINWTRALQDLAIACIAFMLAGSVSKEKSKSEFLENVGKSSRFLFALLLIIFGVQQFLNLDFLTAKVPDYLPLRIFWVYLTGAAMIVTGVSVLANKKARPTAILTGVFLLTINLLYHGYLLANGLHNPLNWTAAMLDLAITCGVFILAAASPKDERDLVEIPE
jgi:uncharacterized membrane protein